MLHSFLKMADRDKKLVQKENLIELVKLHPDIYDETNKFYKDRDVIARRWKEIAESITGTPINAE